MTLLAEADDDYDYSVAWIDTLARGASARPLGAHPRPVRDAATSCPPSGREPTRSRPRADHC